MTKHNHFHWHLACCCCDEICDDRRHPENSDFWSSVVKVLTTPRRAALAKDNMSSLFFSVSYPLLSRSELGNTRCHPCRVICNIAAKRLASESSPLAHVMIYVDPELRHGMHRRYMHTHTHTHIHTLKATMFPHPRPISILLFFQTLLTNAHDEYDRIR